MSIVRVRKDANYFAASNEPFNDAGLSWEARGLMGYLLSKPDNWKINIADLEKKGPAGTHKLRRMLAELRKSGYMNRIRVTLEQNRFDWITEVYESPSQNPNKQSSMRFSTSGQSTSGKVNDIVSTDLPSTELKPASPKIQLTDLSIENQIAAGVKNVVIPDNEQAMRKDVAGIIATGLGTGMRDGFDLVMAFQNARNITFTAGDAKGQRRAVRELLEKHVKPEHVAQAVKELLAISYTVVDFYSIRANAVNLANPSPSAPLHVDTRRPMPKFENGRLVAE